MLITQVLIDLFLKISGSIVVPETLASLVGKRGCVACFGTRAVNLE
jgi:hypothetical protein